MVLLTPAVHTLSSSGVLAVLPNEHQKERLKYISDEESRPARRSRVLAVPVSLPRIE